MSPRAGRDTLSLRERVGVREPASTLAMACMGRFMGSLLFETELLTDHAPWIPGGGTPAATEARFMGRSVSPRASVAELYFPSPWVVVGFEALAALYG
jgi:hypothetical protein